MLSHIKTIVISTGFKRFVNPARIDPKYLSTFAGKSGDGPQRMTLSTLAESDLPALCYTVVFVKESHVHTPYSPRQDGNYLKSLIAKPFCGESDRIAATILMAMNMEEMKAQIDKDWMTYNCRPLKSGEPYIVCLVCNVVDSIHTAAASKQAEIDAGLSPVKSKAFSSPSVVRSSAAPSTFHIQSSLPSEATCKWYCRPSIPFCKTNVFLLFSLCP